ncbi:hypothetical protein BCR43DRAFT_285290 [Syncephalastrum racemosum]|uniref:Uncharacterized protein n=1 Tax=Syncephalastrum racemosum TaxID=13706 RepID=A0A1X2HD70_SYNRA|nr:hypothetical protein BCR43DRAFT_285290 [Syncephalastrum racemosum]
MSYTQLYCDERKLKERSAFSASTKRCTAIPYRLFDGCFHLLRQTNFMFWILLGLITIKQDVSVCYAKTIINNNTNVAGVCIRIGSYVLLSYYFH